MKSATKSSGQSRKTVSFSIGLESGKNGPSMAEIRDLELTPLEKFEKMVIAFSIPSELVDYHKAFNNLRRLADFYKKYEADIANSFDADDLKYLCSVFTDKFKNNDLLQWLRETPPFMLSDKEDPSLPTERVVEQTQFLAEIFKEKIEKISNRAGGISLYEINEAKRDLSALAKFYYENPQVVKMLAKTL